MAAFDEERSRRYTHDKSGIDEYAGNLSKGQADGGKSIAIQERVTTDQLCRVIDRAAAVLRSAADDTISERKRPY